MFIHANIKSSSTSCFKYFVTKNSASFARKTNALVVVDLFAASSICTLNKLIKAKAISPLTFFFKNYFLTLKLNSKAATGIVL